MDAIFFDRYGEAGVHDGEPEVTGSAASHEMKPQAGNGVAYLPVQVEFANLEFHSAGKLSISLAVHS